MREIKFRVWTGIKMEHQVVVGQLGAFYEGGISPTDSACISTTTLYHKETPVMQFTGLRDKNGKEIYEGDIIRINNLQETWKRGEPNFDWRIFSIEWVRYTFVLTNKAMNKPLADYDTRTLQPWDCEIIGNIYSNPELLNAKESTEKK